MSLLRSVSVPSRPVARLEPVVGDEPGARVRLLAPPDTARQSRIANICATTAAARSAATTAGVDGRAGG
jgi:hypothetical protein